MLISVFARGTGAGAGPVDYVTAEAVRALDGDGKPIPGEMLTRDPAPIVMAGDPGLTRALIDSSQNRWKYTSGVIAFAPGDKPTDAEQRAVMADFERLAFAGLGRDEYNVLWVRHEHCGNVELHFVAPRLHLGTGKAYNPCPPGHQAAHDALRDFWNHAKGWADPEDPARSRLVKRDGHTLKIEASALRAGLEVADDPKKLIGEYLVQRMEAGQIKNRGDVLASLEEAGLTFNRQGKDYISVRDGDAKPIRLKGIIYDEKFAFGFDRAAEIRRELGLVDRPAQEQDQGRREGDQRVDAERAQRARQQLEAIIGRRTEFNTGRYHPAERDAATAERDAGQPAGRADELGTDAAGTGAGTEARGAERGAELEGISGSGSKADQESSRNGSQKNAASREPVREQAKTPGLDVVGRGGHELPLGLRDDLGLVAVGGTVGRDENAVGAVSGHERPMGHVQHSSRAEALPARKLEENHGRLRANDSSPRGLSPFARTAGAGAGRAGGVAASHPPSQPRAFQPWRDSSADREGLRTSRLTRWQRMPALSERSVSAGLAQASDSLLFRTFPRSGDLHHRLHSAFADLKDWYDRTRNQIGERLGSAWKAIRGGHAELVTANSNLELATGRTEQCIDEAHRSLDLAVERSSQQQREVGKNVDRLEQQTERACRKLKMNRDDELTRFKSGINLVEYAESNGYQIEKKESSRASTVMKNGDDKIIVATAPDGHGIYFSVRDERDNGSIIDFVQKRQGLNLGQVRKELRPWVGEQAQQRHRAERKPEAERPRKPEPSTADRQQVLAVWTRMQPGNGRHPYLENERKLKPETLADPRFVGMVRTDDRGNAAFPHYDRAGLSGFELKNEGFTGFSKNGQKSVWHSANLANAPRVVLVESAIDAMSHAQLSGDREAAYLSTGGSMSDHQRELVRSALAKVAERGAEIVIAADADEPGRKLAAEVQALAPKEAKICRQEPDQGKDWNDQLKLQLETDVERIAAQRERALWILDAVSRLAGFNAETAMTEDYIALSIFDQIDDYERADEREREYMRNRIAQASPATLSTLAGDAKTLGMSQLIDAIKHEVMNSDPEKTVLWGFTVGNAADLMKKRAQPASVDALQAALAQSLGISPGELDRRTQEKRILQLEQKLVEIDAEQAKKAGDPNAKIKKQKAEQTKLRVMTLGL